MPLPTPSNHHFQSLNHEQQQTALFDEGAALVIAVAGSGKTKTIIERAALLMENGVRPEAIWITTFTNKAAKEIHQRIRTRTSEELSKGIVVGTFHGLCMRIFSRFHLGDDYSIIDQDDSEQIIKICAAEYTNHEVFLKRVKPRDIHGLLSLSVNTQKPLEELIVNYRNASKDDLAHIKQLQTDYHAYKNENKMLDFDDILFNLLNALESDPDLAHRVSRTCRYLIVDEFQDTNKLQFRLIKALCSHHGNLMCVGDDAQSIYAFRGANPKQLHEFTETVKPLTLFKLQKNYRSTQGILEVGNSVLKQMKTPEHLRKHLVSALYPNDMTGVSSVDVNNEFSQTDYIIEQLQTHLKAGTKPQELCILVKYGFHALAIEARLLSNRIPYIKYGGLKFLEKSHIKDVLCFLRYAVNSQDALALIRCLMHIEGVGVKNARKVQTDLRNDPSDLVRLLPRKAQNSPIAELLGSYHGFFAEDLTKVSPAQLITDVLTVYLPVLKNKFKDEQKTYEEKARDLQEVLQIANDYLSTPSFVNDIVLGESALDGKTADDCVLISTIHSIKGLEKDIVFLPNFYSGVYPRNTNPSNAGEAETLEEEKRLLYVAVTRARKQLVLLRPLSTHEGPTKPSPFYNPHSNPCQRINLTPYSSSQKPQWGPR